MKALTPAVVHTVLVLAAAVAGAEESPKRPKAEIVVFGGASVSEVSASTTQRLALPLPVLPLLPVPLPCPFPGCTFPFEFVEHHTLGGSGLLGFRAAYLLSPRVHLEAGLAVAPTHTLKAEATFSCGPNFPCPFAFPLPAPLTSPPVQLSVASYDYSTGVLVELARGRVRPYVEAGPGGITYSLPGGSRTSFAVHGSVGLKVDAGSVGFRAEVRDLVIPDHYLTGKTEQDLQLTGGVILRVP